MQTKYIHTAEPLVREPNSSDVDTAVDKLIMYNHHLILQTGKTLHSEIQKH
jgi:hypothetical protein